MYADGGHARPSGSLSLPLGGALIESTCYCLVVWRQCGVEHKEPIRAESALGPLLGQGRVRRQACPLPRRRVDDVIFEQEEAVAAIHNGWGIAVALAQGSVSRY